MALPSVPEVMPKNIGSPGESAQRWLMSSPGVSVALAL